MANFVLRNNLYLMATLGVAVASYVALNWSSMPVLHFQPHGWSRLCFFP